MWVMRFRGQRVRFHRCRYRWLHAPDLNPRERLNPEIELNVPVDGASGPEPPRHRPPASCRVIDFANGTSAEAGTYEGHINLR